MAATMVQNATNLSAGASSLTISSTNGWTAPTAGNILVAWANSDTTISLTGWTAGPSVVDGNGVYMWYKVATGGEVTIPFTPGGSTSPITVGVFEYSGIGSPRDVQNSNTASGSATTSPSVSATGTSSSGDLWIAVSGIHGSNAGAATISSWSNSFTNRQSVSAGTAGNPAYCVSFAADFQNTSAATVSTVATWTGSGFNDRQALLMAFPITAPPSGAVSLVGSAGVMNITAGAFGPLTSPGTLAVGDFVCAIVSQNQTTAVTWTGTGWNSLDATVNATGGYAPLILYKIWASGDVMPSVTSTTGKWAYVTMAFRADTGQMGYDKIVIDAGQTVAGTTMTSSAVTAANANTVSILAYPGRGATNVATAVTTTPPTNWLEGSTPSVSDISTNSGTTAALRQVSVEACYRLGQAAGAITPGAATFSISSFHTSYHVLAYGIPPAAGVTNYAGWGLRVNL
jgi:hypothetical protein